MAHDYYSPMRLFLTVRCPNCSNAANFIFATHVRIERNVDLPFFNKSKAFEVIQCQDSCGGYYKVAAHFPGLGAGLDTIFDLPAGYKIKQWHRKHNWTPSIDGHQGVMTCESCLFPKKHTLSWPADAWFQIDYKNETLWAYDRETAIKLLSYIESDERKKRIVGTYNWNGLDHQVFSQDFFLRKIPTVFQTKKAREPIVKELKKLLSLPK